jgi:nitrite reductase (NADH) large subunit
MRIIIVGNGVAGTIAGKTIRELDSQAEILIYSEERHPYYPRPNLIDFLAGIIPLEKIFAFPEGWADRQRLQINLGRKIVGINPERPSISLENGEIVTGDYLVLTSGARPLSPPLAGLEKKGVFTLRTLDDVLELLEYLTSGPEVLILGGGLLGLETARALCQRGVNRVSVAEYFDRLLPRQLDENGAGQLQKELEKIGIKFYLGKEAVEVLGNGSVSGVRFKDGQVIPAGALILASGIKPRTELAEACGLLCSRGVLVDDYLRTSHSKVYAAGDVVEHRGKIYGLIPAAFDQARVLAYNLCGQIKRYEGTVPFNTLKVAGIYLTSIGLVNPENGDYEILVKHEPEKGIYKKLILKNDVPVGAIWLGVKKGVQEISRVIQAGKSLTGYKERVFDDNFDFSLILES